MTSTNLPPIDSNHPSWAAVEGEPEGYDVSEIEALDVQTLSPGRLAWKRYWRHKGAATSTVLPKFE